MAFAKLILVVLLSHFVCKETFSCQATDEVSYALKSEEAYVIEEKEELDRERNRAFETRLHSLGGKRILIERTTKSLSQTNALSRSYHFSGIEFHEIKQGHQLMPPGILVLVDQGTVAFGNYKNSAQGLFASVHRRHINNLLTKTGKFEYKLLDEKDLDAVKSDGLLQVWEKHAGQSLATPMGITSGEETHVRNGSIRCYEQQLNISQEEKEKRYTFYGRPEWAPNITYPIFTWRLNNRTGLSCIDSAAGFGSFTFIDANFDGKFETLECYVRDANQQVEVFNISDPWNIKLVEDADLVESNKREKVGHEWLKTLSSKLQDTNSNSARIKDTADR